MIYIISIDREYSTKEVTEWLVKLKKKFLIIDSFIFFNHKLDILPLNFSNTPFNSLRNINATNSPSLWVKNFTDFEEIEDNDLKRFYLDELKALTNFILKYKIQDRKVIGVSIFGNSVNKLEILSIVQKYGLLIPSTLITNSKKDVYTFHKEYKRIISKPISEIFIGKQKNGKPIVSYTKLISKSFVDSLPNNFPSLLFQQYIDKEYEVRIFYLDGKLYPMAIFSQDSQQTKIDFRKYNFVTPNRTIPCKLPQNIEESLLSFLGDHKFDAASVDMVKCKSTGKYYFLEVNPHGQYGMVSKPCNYYLEKKIAELL